MRIGNEHSFKLGRRGIYSAVQHVPPVFREFPGVAGACGVVVRDLLICEEHGQQRAAAVSVQTGFQHCRVELLCALVNALIEVGSAFDELQLSDSRRCCAGISGERPRLIDGAERRQSAAGQSIYRLRFVQI